MPDLGKNMSSGDSFEEYLQDALHSALSLDTASGGTYRVKCTRDGVYVTPYYPADRPIDYSFYTDVYKVLSTAVYPYYTLLKPSGLQLVTVEGEDYATARALFFPWLKGVPQRLIWDSAHYKSAYQACAKTLAVPLMKDFYLDLRHTTHLAIAGQSGSGKSYFLKYLLPFFATAGDLLLVDPKSDDLARWRVTPEAKALPGVGSCLIPDFKKPDGSFLTDVDKKVREVVQELYRRQEVYRTTGKRPYKEYFIVIDELLALTQSAPKKDAEAFFRHLEQIALLGRSAKMHLVLVSQRFSAEALPTVVRDQLQAVFQLGPVTKSTAQFLFPDFDSEGVVPPHGTYGVGICKVEGDSVPYPRPFLSPTVNE